MKHAATVLMTLGAFLGGCARLPPAPPPPSADAHRTAVEAWHAERVKNLTAWTGWLSLVGFFWLEVGDNTFGSAADNALVFPAGAPAHLGRLVLAEGSVRLVAAPDAGLTHDGEPVSELAMTADAAGGPTTVAAGTLRFYVIARNQRLAVRLKDSAAAARTAFHGIERYPVDLGWRVMARFEPYQPAKKVAIPTVLGYAEESVVPGAIVFELGGAERRLDVVDEEPEKAGEPLFVIFGDATNRDTTYGAGRFLYVDPPDENGWVAVDFNRAYNPPCAFTPYATCPLPPSQNRLPLRVEAGEKRYGDH